MNDFFSFLEEYLSGRPSDFIRISVYENGAVKTLDGQPTNPCQNVYSVAKAFTAAAVGLAFDRGLLRPEDKVCDVLRRYVPEGMDERWELTTVDMALTHRTGLPGSFLDIDAESSLHFGRDYLRYMLTFPLSYTPGEGEKYTDGSFYLLSRVVSEVTGKALDDYMWSELLFDLGFTELAWSRCPLGYPMGATGLYIKSEDMVRLGALYLNGGVYGGKRLLSSEWIDLSLKRGYGFGPDSNGFTFSKGGMRGQTLLFAKDLGLAAAMQSYEGNTGVLFDCLQKYHEQKIR